MTDHIVTAGYQGPERRKYSKTLEELEQYVEDRFSEHEVKEQIWIAQLRDSFMSAFPDGDAHGHCEAHSSMIKAKRAEEEFWRTAKAEAIKHSVGGIFYVVKMLTILAIIGLAYKFGAGPAVAKLLGVH